MRYYFYNYTDDKGKHEVHDDSCSFLPSEENRTYIGQYEDCSKAILMAKLKYPGKKFDGCYFCSKSCHTG